MGDLHLGGIALKPLVVLGATGSIGSQTIEVAERLGIPIAAIAARHASPQLVELARALPDAEVCVVHRGDEAERLEQVAGDRLHFGSGSVTEAAAIKNATVVNGIVGSAGLPPSLSALYAGNRLALANKESLVSGGPLVRAALAEGEGELIPIDSEHSAVWQCLRGEDRDSVRRVVLTASGGPFRGRPFGSLHDVTVDEALDHPTWEMGRRITIDSATLMNKGFEVIEAHHLFDLAYDVIDVVVHPESVVHSMVEFVDGIVKAEVGFPDMRKPIQYAITEPDRAAVESEPFDLAGQSLTFEAVDIEEMPCLRLGYEAGRAGGTAPAVLNAADEIAVSAFLDGHIRFTDIAAVVANVLERHDVEEPDSVDHIAEVDEWARAQAELDVEALRA